MATDDEFTAAEYRELADAAAMREGFARDGIPGPTGDFTAEEQAAILASLDASVIAEPLVMRSFRLPLALHDQVAELAKRRGVTFSALLREWMVAGLEQALVDVPPDPVGELHRIRYAATRALNALEHGRAA